MTKKLTTDQRTLVETMIGNNLESEEWSETTISCSGSRSADRYLYDFDLCPRTEGWAQFDTNQDA